MKGRSSDSSIRVNAFQNGRSLRFSAEPREGLRVLGNVLGEGPESEEAVGTSLLCLVDHTHATRTELYEDNDSERWSTR